MVLTFKYYNNIYITVDTQPDLLTRNIELSKDMYAYDNISKIISLDNIILQDPMTIYDEARGFLSDRLVEIPITLEYFYKPEYLSLILYQTTSLWHMILKLNNCLTHKDFNKKIVKVLDPNKLNDLVELINIKKRETYLNKKNVLVIKDLTLRQII